ncbi:MAG: hypothetical protein QNJ41_24980 [Xenococcaceae cyanobacterium MO_188.B32]|nr:hypothetical protein [Xenococcaceae cyanobacterium MO_188.B32]
MSFKSIKLLPILLVLGLVTTLGACNNEGGEVDSPDNNVTEEGIVEPESPAETTEPE